VNTSDSAATSEPHDEVTFEPVTEPRDHSSVESSAEPSPEVATGEPAVSASDEAGQSELDLGVISTGTPVVDRALAPLEGLGEIPVPQHSEVFERVLSDLSATMAEGVADEGSPSDA
jgi:hypothetical protein